MANDLTGRSWKIDTAGAALLWASRINIRYITWVGPAATTDTFEIQDSQSKTIIKSRAQIANDEQTFYLNNWFNGFKVPTLTSGTLYVHLR